MDISLDAMQASFEIALSKEQHDNVIKWKRLPRYWPFVWGIHRSPVNSPQKRPVTRSFDAFFDLRLKTVE